MTIAVIGLYCNFVLMFVTLITSNWPYLISVFIQTTGRYIENFMRLGTKYEVLTCGERKGKLILRRLSDAATMLSSCSGRTLSVSRIATGLRPTFSSARSARERKRRSGRSSIPSTPTRFGPPPVHSWVREKICVFSTLKKKEGLGRFYYKKLNGFGTGLFLAHISRGRTVRQFIMGTLTLPSVYCFVWISIFGGTAIEMERKAAHNGRQDRKSSAKSINS